MEAASSLEGLARWEAIPQALARLVDNEEGLVDNWQSADQEPLRRQSCVAKQYFGVGAAKSDPFVG
jgi:hypothetical protein